MLSFAVILVGPSLALQANASDQGFRFNGTACVNTSGQQGLNPSFFGQCGDLRHVTMSGVSFDGTDFSGAAFDGSDLENTSLNNVNLTGASFVGADLTGVSMTGATIHKANFTQSKLRGTHLAGSDIQNSNFSNSDLGDDLFSTMTLKGNKFSGTNLSGARLDGADVSGSDFSGANLTQANLQGATLDKAVLDDADLTGADLTKASLTGVSADGARLNRTLLRQCDLQEGLFTRASFRGAKFDNATLTQANFTGADLRGAEMTGATFQGAQFEGASINRSTTLPFSPSDAMKMGIVMAPPSLFVIDGSSVQYFIQFVSDLQDMGLDVVISKEDSSDFKGDLDLSLFSSILDLGGNSNSDMPRSGQLSMLSFVQQGGTYINTGSEIWTSYAYMWLQSSLDLILFKPSNYRTDTVSLSPAAGQDGHPLFRDMKFPAVTSPNMPYLNDSLISFASSPATVLMNDTNGNPIVASRNLGTGHVVNISLCTVGNMNCLSDSVFQRLVFNASNW